MSSPLTVSKADPKRVASIAAAISAAVSPITGADQASKDASDAFQETVNAKTGLREGIMVELAGVSLREGWTKGEVDLAAAQATKMANNVETAKALATFIGECKAAMDPKVRAHVAFFLDIKNEVWAAEGAGGKDDPKPCRKAFKRGYHMLQRMMKALRDDGVFIDSAARAVEYAEACNPDHDLKAVMGRLKAIRAQLSAFAADFPVEGFASIDEFIGEITEKTLKAARDGLLAAQEDVLQTHTLAPVPDVVVQRVAAAKVSPTVVEVTEEPEVDAIEAALDELTLA